MNRDSAPQPDCSTRPATVADLRELVRAGHRYSTIYADPPWDYDNRASRGAAVKAAWTAPSHPHWPATPFVSSMPAGGSERP
ncbi:MAG: hypothetical protein N2C14_18325 [Planctomycetales bacterium]